MKGDFTRFGFDPSKHFSRVLQQQGRVALDSDSNLSASVLLHHLRALTRDLYGEFGGPANSGFSLALDTSASPSLLWISPGHYYVDGILCENEEWVDYASQPDHSVEAPDANGAGGDALLAWLRSPVQQQSFWLYLDVWERHLTWIEDESIREPALGGPDTTTRAKVVWQVKAQAWDPQWGSASSGKACGMAPMPEALGSARMGAQVDPGPAFTDPCVIAPGAKYRGTENHLYRIEVHTGGGANTATFKWSRDNGSLVTRWLGVGNDANALIVKSSRGFAAGDWVELSHDALDLAGLPGTLVRLSVVEGDQLTVDPDSTSADMLSWSAALSNPKVRRWDQRANDVVGLRDGAVPVTESAETGALWIDIEDGLQVAFVGGGTYRSGDYWLVTARVATQGIEWPLEEGQPAFLAPQGIVHAYAPLGVLWFNSDNVEIEQCRRCVDLAQTTCALPTAPARAFERASVGTKPSRLAPPAPAKAALKPKRRRPT